MEKYGLTIELKDFTQKQFEIYQPFVIKAAKESYVDFGGGTGVTANSILDSNVIKAALAAEFLTGVTAEQIGDMKPHIVKWLADEVRKHVKTVLTAPPDPN